MAKDEFGPVEPDNLPTSRRPDPDGEQPAAPTKGAAGAPAPDTTRKPARGSAAGGGRSRGTRGRTPAKPPVAAAGALTRADLMRGAADPWRNLHQSGVRLPAFLQDAVRTAAMLSAGAWTQQSLIAEAVEKFLPADIVEEAWVKHGGTPGQREQFK